jgi:hypothetical protein
MKQKTRRQFLTDLGFSVGAITLVRGIIHAGPFSLGEDKKGVGGTGPKPFPGKEAVDFRYAPKSWQSTFCFPDDPHKSLVGKHGELLYGYTGNNQGIDAFMYVLQPGLSGMEGGNFVGQSLASPELPLITTTLSWKNLSVALTTFATNGDDEGRVDNMLVEITGQGTVEIPCTPEIIIKTGKQFSIENKADSSSDRGQIGILTAENDPGHPFLLVDSNIRMEREGGLVRLKLSESTVTATKKVKFILRLPQEQQPFEKIKDGMKDAEKLLRLTRSAWESWHPFDKKVSWNLVNDYQKFLVASSRNMIESRDVKNQKPVFGIGPTRMNEMSFVDTHFILESMRYLGFDDAAQKGLQVLWDSQLDDGTFPSVTSENNWKDIAIAVYALIRNAELTQNWDYFNELYPDAWKAMMYLQGIQKKAWDGSTLNGKYGLLPAGYGDHGLDGSGAELINTLWVMIAVKAMSQTADRFLLQKNIDIRQFYTDLMVNFNKMAKVEMVPHPQGFAYLPMLLKDDPRWKDTDVQKKPNPQTAQVYLSQAIYPGRLFDLSNDVVKGHIELMKSVLREEVPAETGRMKVNAVCPLDAAVMANTLLWAEETDFARQIFLGFLNHASPLYAWHEEQSLLTSNIEAYQGDMPQSRAAAECVRFLRHILVFEDEKDLCLLRGVGQVDLGAKKPFSITSSPTRWGRVTLSMEPAPPKHWVTKFKREEFDVQKMPPLSHVFVPRALPGNVRLDHIKGAQFLKNGLRVEIDPLATSWEAVWVDYGNK